MGLTAVEAVPALEPAGERPRRPRRGHVRLVVRAQMPLADGIGGIALLAQYLREEAVLAGRPAPVAGVPHGEVGHAPHAAAMMIAPRQQARTRGGAEGGGVKVRQTQARGGQGVDRRRGDGGAVATELGEPHVIEHDKHDIRRPGRRGHLRRPPWLRVPPVSADAAAELPLLRHRPPSSSLMLLCPRAAQSLVPLSPSCRSVPRAAQSLVLLSRAMTSGPSCPMRTLRWGRRIP